MDTNRTGDRHRINWSAFVPSAFCIQLTRETLVAWNKAIFLILFSLSIFAAGVVCGKRTNRPTMILDIVNEVTDRNAREILKAINEQREQQKTRSGS